MISTILMVRNKPFILWTDTPNLNKARPWLKDKLRAYWIKLVFRNAVAVMSTGKPGCEAMAKLGCPKGKIINFPYWTPLPTEWSDCNNISKTSTIFFSIGRLNRIKGYDLLLVRSFIPIIGKILNTGYLVMAQNGRL